MKPVWRIVLVLIITAFICQLSFLFLRKGLNQFYIHKTSRLTDLFLKDHPYDVLFIGSSRTHNSINPRIIDSICNVNSYNAGIEGGNLFEFTMTLEAYLSNHRQTPKLIVLTLDLASFDLKRKLYDPIQYYPFLNNKIVSQTLAENIHPVSYFKVFPFLELADYDDYTRTNCIKGNLNKTEILPGDFEYKGYLSNTENHIDTTIYKENLNTTTENIEKEAVKKLDGLILLCKKLNIQLIFTYAPEYKRGLQKAITNSDDILSYIKTIASENDIIFLRHDTLRLCQNPLLFSNPGHLNKRGAELYSVILANELKASIK